MNEIFEGMEREELRHEFNFILSKCSITFAVLIRMHIKSEVFSFCEKWSAFNQTGVSQYRLY